MIGISSWQVPNAAPTRSASGMQGRRSTAPLPRAAANESMDRLTASSSDVTTGIGPKLRPGTIVVPPHAGDCSIGLVKDDHRSGHCTVTDRSPIGRLPPNPTGDQSPTSYQWRMLPGLSICLLYQCIVATALVLSRGCIPKPVRAHCCHKGEFAWTSLWT